MSDQKLTVETVRQWFQLAYDADQAQRDREDDDLAYQVAENQWDAKVKAAREGRPTLAVSKISQPQQLIMGAARNARLALSFHPVSEDAEHEVAETMDGLAKRIERDSNAQVAWMWALDRASKAGRGYFLVDVAQDEDADELDPRAFDLEIRVRRILHQSCVFFDPSATEADNSDAEYVFVTDWLSAEKFKRMYPQATKTVEAADNEAVFSELQRSAPGWVRESSGKRREFMVVTCWYKEHETQTLYLTNSGKIVTEKPKDGEVVNTRQRDKVTVCVAKVSGAEIIQREKWLGDLLPVCIVSGNELQPFGTDLQRRFEGVIRPARGAQELFNGSISAFVERMLSEPKNPWMVAEGQDEGYEDEYRLANVKNFPVMHYRPVALGDKLVPPPQRTQLDTTGMSLTMQGANFASQLIQDATFTYDPSLGKQQNKDESGRHALALQSQGDLANGAYLDNFARITLPYYGKVLKNLMPRVYDAEGRVTTVLGGDDEQPSKVMLNAPHVMKDGRPVAVDKGTEGAKTIDFRRGVYGVAATVGKSNETRLQQAAEGIGQLIEHVPEWGIGLADLYIRAQDLPFGEEMADRMRKLIALKFPGILDNAEDAGQKAQAENQSLKAQMQQMGQQLQQAGQIIQTKQVEQRGKVEAERVRVQGQITMEQIRAAALDAKTRADNATKLAVARITAAKEGIDAEREDREEALALGLQLQHDTAAAAEQRAHEMTMAQAQAANAQQAQAQQGAMDADAAAEGREHESAMAESGQQHDAAMAAAGQDHEAQMAAQQRAAAAEQPEAGE